jgi:hypothetical protein
LPVTRQSQSRTGVFSSQHNGVAHEVTPQLRRKRAEFLDIHPNFTEDDLPGRT